LLLFKISFGFRGYDTSSGCATFSPSDAEKGLFRRFPTAGEHQLLLLMQRILAFRASFVDMSRSFVKLRVALFRWNSPCEIESAIILN
jgi:hypothetical protein